MAADPAPPGVHAPVAAAGRPAGLLLLGLAIVAAMGSLSIDLYIPSMPRIGTDLGVTEPLVQTTLTGALIGFAVGQIAFGPLVDRFGRRRPLLLANAVLVATALVCALAPSIAVLIGMRVLQGAACAAGTVVATATVRDLYEGRPFIRAIGHILAVTAAVPVLAPSIGGLMLSVMSWRALFVVIAVLAAAATALYLLWVPETAPTTARISRGRSVLALVASYRHVLRDRRFAALTLLTTCVWGGATWTYVTNSSFVFQSAFGLSEVQFGVAFGINALCGWLGVQIGSRVSVRLVSVRVVAIATYTGAACTLALWVTVVAGVADVLVVAIGVALLYLSAGVMTPHIAQLSLERLGDATGAASALPGAATLMMAALAGPATAAFGSHTAVPMASTMLLAMMAACVVYAVRLRPRSGGRRADPSGQPCG